MNAIQLGWVSGSALVGTLFQHVVNRKAIKDSPLSDFSYHSGFNLLKTFLDHSVNFTVEELQGLTAQEVPVPHWVHIEKYTCKKDHIAKAAEYIEKQLGEEGIRRVGGKKWWKWRPDELRGEWVQTRKLHEEKKANNGGKSNDTDGTALLYIHGGAFYFGSVDCMRFQLQSYAKKINTRVLAPNYRLAPQFPFPCALHDVLACYLDMLTIYPPEKILIAGDSAGGNLSLALMVILRDQGLPLPAGAILLSPWVDLTHSFPSCAKDATKDYIPHRGFHHKPSIAWPPPAVKDYGEEKAQKLGEVAEVIGEGNQEKAELEEDQDASGNRIAGPVPEDVVVEVDGKKIRVREQIHMYAPNELVTHPLVSLVNQGSLGGLPPILITTGSGEKLSDEHIWTAYKMADPSAYPPNEEVLRNYPEQKDKIKAYPPTDVKLQVFDDCCHVVTALAFTKPAKYMNRSIGAFGKYCLARASGNAIMEEIVSVENKEQHPGADGVFTVGKFENHMIRERVNFRGEILPFDSTDHPALLISPNDVGTLHPSPIKLWLEAKASLETKFGRVREKLQHKLNKENFNALGDLEDGENPPPSAAYRRRKREVVEEQRPNSRESNAPARIWSTMAEEGGPVMEGKEETAETEAEVAQKSKL